jgi:hypothetical protein
LPRLWVFTPGEPITVEIIAEIPVVNKEADNEVNAAAAA